MSIPAIVDYFYLWTTMENVVLTDQPDKTVWRWTPDGTYNARSAYNMMHTGAIKFRGHTLIWKTWAPLRVKIFLCLALKHRHWTADRRARHGLEARENCYLCDQAPGTIDHIIASCPNTQEVWFYVCQALGQNLPQQKQSTIYHLVLVEAAATI